MNGLGRNLRGDGKVLKLDCDDESVNLLKIFELYTYNGRILWYINNTSVKLLKMCPEPGEMDKLYLAPAATATPTRVCAWKISPELALTPQTRDEDWGMMGATTMLLTKDC